MVQKSVVLLLLTVVLSFGAEIANIGFSDNSWAVASGVTFTNDTLSIEGDLSQYQQTKLTVSVPANTENLYFMADIYLDDIVMGEKSHQAPKFKIYDNTGKSLQAFNMPALIQNQWYTTGMVIKRFNKLNLSSITLEFGVQNCSGTMRVRNPKLLDTPPPSEYTFPFETPTNNSSSIDIVTTEKNSFEDRLLSVNSHFVWASSSWGDDDMGKIFNERLSLGNLRFPGGTVGNFYDWESDGFYGDEWTFLSASRKKAYEEGFRFGFDGFANRCKELNASATLMFNVIQDDIEKAKNRLRNRIESGITIDWIEMGNENFFTEQAFGNVATMEKYIAHTKSLASALKEVSPSIEVGVNLNHHDYSNGSWNLTLAQEDFYDVAIIHPYVQTNSFLLNNYSAKIMLSAYKTTTERIAEYQHYFGDKPLIFTEWGILSEGSPSNFVQALGVADMFLAIIEGADKGIVKQAGIHMLYHSDNYNESTLYFKENGIMKRSRLGVVYEKIVHLFKGSDLYSAKGKSALLEEGLQGVNCRAVVVGDSIKVFAVNKTPQASNLAISIDGVSYTGEFQIETFSEAILGDSTGYSFEENPWVKTAGTGAISLPENSIAIITLPKDKTAISSSFKKTFPLFHSSTTVKGIHFSASEKGRVTLYNLQGKLLEQKSMVLSGIVGQNLSKGLYLLSFEKSGTTITHKIMLQ